MKKSNEEKKAKIQFNSPRVSVTAAPTWSFIERLSLLHTYKCSDICLISFRSLHTRERERESAYGGE